MRKVVRRVGDYKQPIDIQTPTRVNDGGGGNTPGWTSVFGEIRGTILPMTDSRLKYAGMQLEGQVSHEIKTSYADGVTERERVVSGSRKFDILHVHDWLGQHVEMSIFCVERKGG